MAMSRRSTSTAQDVDSTAQDIDSTAPDFDCDGTCYIADNRLETWDDPTPRNSEFSLEDLREACVAAIERQFNSRAKSPTREERLKYRDEHDRNSLMIALQAYAKKNNMQSTDLEFVEVKQRNLIDECGKGFLHFNFSVKDTDGKFSIFFAEVHPNLKDEKDVYLCMPLDDKDSHPSKDHDQAHCYGCKDRAKDLVHPSSGGFLGGHKDFGFPFMEFESDDESSDEDD